MPLDFDATLDRIKQQRLWDFPGGVHPDERKALTSHKSISQIPLANRFYVPLKQHIGVEGSLRVNIGDKVQTGQALTKSTNPFSVPIHAPTSGTVVNIGEHVSAHPSALPEMTIEIEADGLDEWCELSPMGDFLQAPKMKIIEQVCKAGISGMGGAGFPTHIKASPKKDVEFLIVNGAECEPYITSDDRLMREHAWQIRQGVDILNHLLTPKTILIAIEDNKPEAIEAMQVACQDSHHYRVVTLPTKYPAGGEKQLIQVLTGREVPQQGLPIDVGVIMQNVGTCYAIADAVISGKPLIERVVTLTGDALENPRNMWVRIGTPVSHLLTLAEYRAKKQETPTVIMGGPMMGYTLASKAVPVVKTTNCLLVPAQGELSRPEDEQPCIRCSACADACPASLLPQQLFWHSKAKEYDKAQEYDLFDCIECGACAYVCPSEIPLVHYYRVAKADIRSQEEEKDKADKARERFEARKERLEKEKQAREEKHRKAAEARKQAMQKDGNAQDKIAAALARAKAKKAAQSAEPNAVKNAVQNDNTAVLANANTAEPASSSNDKKAAVAAAIARAKAKKQAQQTDVKESNQASKPNAAPQSSTQQALDESKTANTEPTQPVTDKKAKIAAAVAKAKAKKLAAQVQNNAIEEESSDSIASSKADVQDEKSDKQARIAAAVARAKAKQQAQAAASLDEHEIAEDKAASADAPAADDKKAKIAAAVARAKAKKQRAAEASKNKDEN